MSVTSVEKDFDKLTLTMTADFTAPVERVWQLWDDPRQLERWWGPPTYPATVVEHDLTPGGTVTYFMTSPDGERSYGWWRITSVNPPTAMEFIDGFGDQDGKPVEGGAASTVQLRLSEHEGGTRMEIHSIFDSREQMDWVLSVGAEEGLRQAVGQIDALLAN